MGAHDAAVAHVRRAIVLLAALLAAPAIATTKTPPAEAPEARADAAAKAAAVSASIAASRSTSASHATASPTAAASAGSSTSGVTLAQSIEGNAPAAYAPDISPTAPCLNGWSMGGSGMGGGLSFGKGREVPGCVQRELIRMAAEMGLADHARFLWCNQAEALNVFGSVEVCMGFGAPATAAREGIERAAIEETRAREREACEVRVERATSECAK